EPSCASQGGGSRRVATDAGALRGLDSQCCRAAVLWDRWTCAEARLHREGEPATRPARTALSPRRERLGGPDRAPGCARTRAVPLVGEDLGKSSGRLVTKAENGTRAA